MTDTSHETRGFQPIDEPLAFPTATMSDADGTVLSEANCLMIKLLPRQP